MGSSEGGMALLRCPPYKAIDNDDILEVML